MAIDKILGIPINAINILYGETLPEAGENYRGRVFFKLGTSYGEDDKLYCCMKDSEGYYSWILIARGD